MDDDIFTYYESTSNQCWVGYDFGLGIKVEISELQFILKDGTVA